MLIESKAKEAASKAASEEATKVAAKIKAATARRYVHSSYMLKEKSDLK